MTFKLPELGYEYNALEPHIDAQTMEIHHSKHHAGYTAKFNAALEKQPALFDSTAEDIVANLSEVPADIQGAVRNNGGGYVNHKLFWSILKKDVQISESFAGKINEFFTSMENFKEEFSKAAATQFGSGWAWLVTDSAGILTVTSTANQDSPLSDGVTPVLGLDVWEHAYYLKYQNKRPAYIEAFFNVVNWEEVERRYNEATK